MNKFELTSAYQPTGDQPEAIAQLTEGVREGLPAQTLLGVTGSGKTFTIANVIANINKPTLILSHNKTAADPVVQRVQGILPEQCRRILCVLLRLLSARSLPAIIGHLYRKRPRHQRRDRQVAPCRHLRPAFGQERCSGGILRFVHIRHGESGRLLQQRPSKYSKAKISVAMSSCDAWWTVFTYATTLT